jgi:hypothetical protein
MASNMERLEQIVGRLPETTRVDIEAWGGEPTFRAGGKNFVFVSPDATSISGKLPKEEAAAVIGTDPHVGPTGYGPAQPFLDRRSDQDAGLKSTSLVSTVPAVRPALLGTSSTGWCAQ